MLLLSCWEKLPCGICSPQQDRSPPPHSPVSTGAQHRSPLPSFLPQLSAAFPQPSLPWGGTANAG